MKNFNDYRQFIDTRTINEILRLAKNIKGKHIVMINSTPSGGGVSEILNSLVLLLADLGLKVGWRVLKGSDNFFQVTKQFHNGLQGEEVSLSTRKIELYEETNADNAIMTHLDHHDLVVVHDPQPLALLKFMPKKIPWLWRCHIDLSKPSKQLLRYLIQFINMYDGMIVSSESYKQKSLKINQFVIPPSIDPLSIKNIKMPQDIVLKILARHKIKPTKPIICQISRFDKWKDPEGVVDVFKKVKKKIDCQLILLGNMALDDPEGPIILKRVLDKTKHDKDITILVNAPDNDRTVNALQTFSKVILQKSLKEGFALTVSEAMWKGTPVVGTKVGGIPLQIIPNQTGFLVNNSSEAAMACLELLHHPEKRIEMGKMAIKHVKQNFLITRHLLDYLRLFNQYLHK